MENFNSINYFKLLTVGLFFIFQFIPLQSDAASAPTTDPGVTTAASSLLNIPDAAAMGNAKLIAGNKPSLIAKLECGELAPVGNAASLSESFRAPGDALLKACGPLKAADQACFGIFETTKKMCFTEENENISSSIAVIQGLMAVASGVTNACNNFAKAMNVAKMGMAAYTAACGAAQVACNSKCGAAEKSLNDFGTALKAAEAGIAGCLTEAGLKKSNTVTFEIGIAMETACSAAKGAITQVSAKIQPEWTASGATITAKASVCKISVPEMLGTALINLGAIAQGMAQSDQCKADAEAQAACTNPANAQRADCVAAAACTNPVNKDRADCKSLIVDCGMSENTDKPICICKANPRMAGCEGVSTSLATNSALGAGNASGLGSSRLPNGGLVNAPALAATGAPFEIPKNGNGTDGSGGSGGGGASSAGLSGGSGGSPEKTSADGSKDAGNANILSTEGGGGGGFKSGFGGYSSPEYRDKLKSFANKNGIGAKIAGNGWKNQVTDTGGKSNFEKVKTRYQENKSTLLGGR